MDGGPEIAVGHVALTDGAKCDQLQRDISSCEKTQHEQ